MMSLVHIALYGKEDPISLAEISAKQNIDIGYLEQIFMQLKSAGIVISARGAKGGYKLARPKDELLVSEIMSAVSENLKVTRCDSKAHEGCMHDKSRCATHHLWANFEGAIYNFLNGISLDDVCNKKLTSTCVVDGGSNAA